MKKLAHWILAFLFALLGVALLPEAQGSLRELAAEASFMAAGAALWNTL